MPYMCSTIRGTGIFSNIDVLFAVVPTKVSYPAMVRNVPQAPRQSRHCG